LKPRFAWKVYAHEKNGFIERSKILAEYRSEK